MTIRYNTISGTPHPENSLCAENGCTLTPPSAPDIEPTLRDIEALVDGVTRVQRYIQGDLQRIDHGLAGKLQVLSKDMGGLEMRLEAFALLLEKIEGAAQRTEAAMTRAVNLLERAEQPVQAARSGDKRLSWAAWNDMSSAMRARVRMDLRPSSKDPDEPGAAMRRVVQAARVVDSSAPGWTAEATRNRALLRCALDALDVAQQQEAPRE